MDNMNYLVLAIVILTIAATVLAFNKKASTDHDLVEVSGLLFPGHRTEVQQFLREFNTDRSAFMIKYADLLEDHDNFDLDQLRPLDVLYIYGIDRELVWLVDWRGEENEWEIESFVEKRLPVIPDWNNVKELRQSSDRSVQRDGSFVVDLLRTIDKDLAPLDKQLIFFAFDWDSYVFAVVDRSVFAVVTGQARSHFHGTEQLKK